MNRTALFISVVCQAGLAMPAAAGDWTAMDSHTAVNLYGLWGSSERDVFAVGNAGTIVHYDGNAWSAMNSGTTKNLSGVFGFAANDVYVVGQNMTILHYNGQTWSAMNVVNPPSWLPSLNGVWGSAPNDIWAVGSGYIRVHYNGSTWSGTTNTVTDWLWSAWGSSASNVFAVGDWQALYLYDGKAWSAQYTEGNWLWSDLRGVWGAGPNEVYIAGDYDSSGFGDGDNSGAVWKYDGSRWTFMWQNVIPDLLSIWGFSGSDFYVSGRKGGIAHSDGKNFTVMSSNTTNDLQRIWGSGTTVFAVGNNGTILRYGASGGAPSIATSGVVNGASFQPGIVPNSWITIRGANLAATTNTWEKNIVNGNLPTTFGWCEGGHRGQGGLHLLRQPRAD